MKLDIFVKKASNLYAENRLLKFAVVIIGITTFINTGLLYVSMSHQRTILIPAGMNTQASVTKTTADHDYLRQMARYVTGLALNYTPSTARSQFEELLNLYTADTFADNKSMLYDLVDTIEKTMTGSVFHPQRFVLDDEKQWIEIVGPKILYLQDIKSGNTELKTYLLKYRMVDGKFQMIELVEKE